MTRWLVGAYGADMDGSAPGIVTLRSRPDGSLEPDETIARPLASPSFLAADATRVYATLEGSREIVALDRQTLVEVARSSSGGQWPCHVSVVGDVLIAANYGDGVLGVIDTATFELVQAVTAEGSGPHPAQEGPHAHSSLALPDGRVLSADLGADRVHVHTVAEGRLQRTASVALPAGTGPRDLLRHPSGHALVLGEHGNTVTVLDASLAIVESVAVPGALDADQGAGLVLSDAGFVYTLLRGSNLVGVLRIGDDGRGLRAIGTVSTAGDWPRHLALDGDVLHVANQQSATVASFRLAEDGSPTLIAAPTAVANPTYLLPV